MIKPDHRVYALDGSRDPSLLLQKIGAVFPGGEEADFPVDEVYLDTFDWRMYFHGLMLRRQGSRLLLVPFPGTISIGETTGPKKKVLFWWDLPEGEVRESLKSVVDVRALCPIFRLVGERKTLQMHNRDDKTVVRLSLDTGRVVTKNQIGRRLSPLLSVMEVRGYRKQFSRVIDLLRENGLAEPASGASVFELALGVIGRQPGEYRSKFSVQLKPDQSLSQAIKQIGIQLHRSMTVNLPGVLDDIDTEFLHDFRVAVRRTRSLLSQFKKALPPGQRSFFSCEFKWLGEVTGTVRDLDVCLKKEAAFRTLLSEDLYPGLDRLLSATRRRRKTEFLKMRDRLSSARTTDLLANWHEFLVVLPDDIQWPAGQKPCRAASRKAVAKCSRRLLHYVSLIVDGDERDSAMHRLRIQGKKFRYLMEFFRSLFPEDATARLLKQMKGFQNDLGDYNDMAVQIEKFRQDLKTASGEPQIRDCLEGLIEGLEAAKRRLRRRCLKKCRNFMAKDGEDLFSTLLLGNRKKS